MGNDENKKNHDELRVRNVPGSRKVSYKEGAFIFQEGEAGDTAFVVLSGKVEISRCIDDKTIPIGVVNVGGMFGEMALIDDCPRMASARAVEGWLEVLVISRRVFEAKLETADPFHRALINILTKHVRTLADKLAKLETQVS